MKKIIILLLIVHSTLITDNCMCQWAQMNSGTAINLNKIQFVNSQTGWAGGYQSMPTQYILIKTTNGGINWISQVPNLPYGNRFMSLYFTDANTGYVAGGDGMFKTTNGGNNYSALSCPTVVVYDCFFVNSSTGWAVGSDTTNRLAKTTNGGINWVLQTSGISSSEQIYHVYFANANTGWCAGINTIYKTTNGGTNWNAQTLPQAVLINGVFAISPESAWILGYMTILSTTNGGTNWILKPTGASNTPISAYFLNSNTGYVCTSPRNVFKTTNNGLNWTAQMSDTAQSLNSIYFTSLDTGYVCGPEGKIYKTINGGSVGIRKTDENIPNGYCLYQNYPNPFNPGTNISYKVQSYKVIKLSVYDVLGKEIATLVNEKQLPGTYQITFDGSGLSSGVYFYKLTAGDFSETKKALLIK